MRLLVEQKKVCDSLLDRIECLEAEKTVDSQKIDVPLISRDCCQMLQPAKQRKCNRTGFRNEDSIKHDALDDGVHSVEHSISLEDDVIGPTQIEPHQAVSNKLRKIELTHTNRRSKARQSRTVDVPTADAKSPSVLAKKTEKTRVILTFVL